MRSGFDGFDAASMFSASSSGRLAPLGAIKYNPGKLVGHYYVPEGLAAGAPLVVVLHGCTQTAAGYDQGSGWSRLAERHGFALLFPEQQRENNPNLCFNWFASGDSQRGMGEPASIASMVEAMRAAHAIDDKRIFVTGLSAGGAMASVMLATYPELFAAGAIIAGLPYGCASDVRGAFDCMGGRSRTEAAALESAVRRASPHKGKWPRVSIWQGSADPTVAPSNADALALQWSQLHGLAAEPSRVEQIEGYPRSVWLDKDGEIALERYDIIGMAHGTPLMPGVGEGQSGQAGAHMIDARISSTDRIAAFFGIAPEPAQQEPKKAKSEQRARKQVHAKLPATLAAKVASYVPKEQATGVQQVIEDALRAAGLMR